MSNSRSAREDFFSGNYSEAASKLEKGAKEDGVDQLVYLLDRATALHFAGRYDESIKDFQLADRISEIKDYTSISTEAATLVTNERIKPYTGEDFERVLISQYLALNYLMLDNTEDALVECRRVNHKLRLMITEGKRKYKLNPMALYLSAMIYESIGEWDDAYIDYQAVYKLIPDFFYLRRDLYRLAWKTRNVQDIEKWSIEFDLSEEEKKDIKKRFSEPEVIFIVENGFSPEKRPNPAWNAIPKFYPKYSPYHYAHVLLDGKETADTHSLFNVENAAIENLEEKFGGILAKKLAGVAVKLVVADQVEERVDPLAGALLRLGMFVADQADLRSWTTLPKDFQVTRLKVNDLKDYQIAFVPVDESGGAESFRKTEKLVHLEAIKRKKHPMFFFHTRLL
ncbi:MAG: COG3014 family protein [Bacteriovoracia bacterium]